MTAFNWTDAIGLARQLRTTLAGCALALVSANALAELGGDAGSIQAEAARIRASVRVTSFAAYTVNELHAPNGATVRQYGDRSGKIFAVVWRTPGPPDLRQLLGVYYSRYLALGTTRIDLHHAALDSPQLVVEVGGVLRTFAGRAYIPAQLPLSLDPGQIR